MALILTGNSSSLTVDSTSGITFPNSTTQASGSKVLQVVTANLTTGATTNSTSPTASGLSVSITPLFSTSKIFLTATFTGGATASNLNLFSFARGTTVLQNPNGNGASYFILGSATSYNLWGFPVALNYIDSPATTSSTTYSVYYWTDNAGNTVGFNARGNATVVGQATIVAMEIAA